MAWSPDTTSDQLESLSEDPDPHVRAAATQNAPEALLRKMAGDRHAMVRAAVAANPQTPREVLFALVEDKSKFVRFWLIVHKDRELLRRLTNDPDEFNARTARTALQSMRPHRRVADAATEGMARIAMEILKRRSDG